jgi:ribonucleoside-diphosphate reductase alpha chain
MEYKDVLANYPELTADQRSNIEAQIKIMEPLLRDRIEETIATGGIDIREPIVSENARTILETRYFLKDPVTGKPLETAVQMFIRVAFKLALVELPYKVKDAFLSEEAQEDIENVAVNETLFHFIQYYNIMHRAEFIPAGRTLANEKHSVPNCIVLHPNDNMESIFETLKQAALLQKAGCGLGFPLHLMRPTGSRTVASGGQSSGPISFLHAYNTAFSVVKQQSRHGANMAICRVDHPDILEFIHCKSIEGDLRNFNISVGLSNEFMERVCSNDPSPWKCRFDGVEYNPRRITRGDPIRPRFEVDFEFGPLSAAQLEEEAFVVQIANPIDGRAVGENYRLKPIVQPSSQFTKYKIEDVIMTARELFNEILQAAWSNGEPGCVFLDRANETNPLPALGRIESSNPCGEQFLHDGDVCNLGAVNMSVMVTPDGHPNMVRIKEAVRAGIRMLDCVVDTFRIPVEKVQTMSQMTRRCGLGIMGYKQTKASWS